MPANQIVIKGARQHNLRNLDVVLPRDKLIVITGPSGSGKSSLAFDTIYAEGRRRYVESLSAYARQFLGQMDKPDVDLIDGLSPAISIEQKTTGRNPRSTVGTTTEIYDYLRLLFARCGTPTCYKCGSVLQGMAVDQIIETIQTLPEGTKVQLLGPVVRGKKGEYKKELQGLIREGFTRVRIDGEILDLDDSISLDKRKKHSIDVVVDRLVIRDGIRERLADAVESCLRLGEGVLTVLYAKKATKYEETSYSQHYSCLNHPDVVIEDLQPRMFSFNAPQGACEECHGLGERMEFDQDKVIPDYGKSLREGAVASIRGSIDNSTWVRTLLVSLTEKYGYDLDTPLADWQSEALDALLYGTDEELRFEYERKDGSASGFFYSKWEGIIPGLERRYRETASDGQKEFYEQLMTVVPCPSCDGKRLRKESLAVKVDSHSIHEVTGWPITDASSFMENLHFGDHRDDIAEKILKEIRDRLGFLVNVGVGYLSLSRKAGTLSGGESQRIRLASQIGSQLVGVLYVLDEPTIGLHQRDNQRLIDTLVHLRDIGNTLIVVEHDDQTMRAADYIVDLGPGAGIHGGQIVSEGPPNDIMSDEASVTGGYLSGAKEIPIPSERRKGHGTALAVKGATVNNLKGIDIDFPLGTFTSVSGVSGSGKSSLVNEVLVRALHAKLNRKPIPPVCKAVGGIEHIDKLIVIDQSPIGRTPRSNPATYTGMFTPIRELFAQMNEAKMRGYKPGRFSFNVKGGRCEACSGDGQIKIEMHFLPDVYVQCDVCKGKRYNYETLQVTYKGKSIADVLDLSIEEAAEFFQSIPSVANKVQALVDVGLGYVKLGQPATTLSGGEAQRVKLASELSRRSTGRTVYVLDEPTTGLHFDDVRKLIEVLQQLVDKGNTVITIEHNLDMIKVSDFVIDLGPEGGDGGGTLVTKGTPEDLAAHPTSHTGRFLKELLHLSSAAVAS